MKLRWMILFGGIVILGGASWWFAPAQVLKRKTHRLMEVLTFEAGGGGISRQAGSYALNGLLAREVTLETPTNPAANGTFERSELESVYAWLGNQAKQSRFTVTEFQAVKVDGEKARIQFSLEALVELPSERPADGRYRATIDWEKVDDRWQLNRAFWTKDR